MKKRRETIMNTIHNELMLHLRDALSKKSNARTIIVPNKMDPTEHARIAGICQLAEKLVDDINDSDNNALETINRIAQDATNKI